MLFALDDHEKGLLWKKKKLHLYKKIRFYFSNLK